MGDRKPFVVIPIGDIQWAGDPKQVALDQLKATIARGMEKDAWFVGMGDFIDFMSPSNRQRIMGAALYDSAMDVIDNAATDLVQELYEKVLKPAKGRFLGCVEGHHLSHLKTGETTDMALCRLLNCKFLGTSAFIRLRFEFGEHDRKTKGFCGNVVLWVHHGTGGGIKAHAPLNKIENIAPYFDADVFLIGHMSKLATAPINRIYPRWDGKHAGDLVHRKVFLVGTGGYSKAYIEHRKDGNVPRDNYVGQKMLNPASLGSPTIYMYPQIRTKQEDNVSTRWFDPTISVEI